MSIGILILWLLQQQYLMFIYFFLVPVFLATVFTTVFHYSTA